MNIKTLNFKPDFYLASIEYDDLRDPRECWFIKRLKFNNDLQAMMLRISPSIQYSYNLNEVQEINTIVIRPRHVVETLFPVSEWPLFVFINKLLVDLKRINDEIHSDECACIFWGEIYQTKQKANEAMKNMWN